MFDIAWSELLIIAVVALVVIGPKDLPRALHTVGKWVAKARSLAREFQNNVDDMVRQTELEDLRRQVEQARSFNLQQELEKSIDPKGEVRQSLQVEDFTTKAGEPAATTQTILDKPASGSAPVAAPATPVVVPDPEEEADLAAAAAPSYAPAVAGAPPAAADAVSPVTPPLPPSPEAKPADAADTTIPKTQGDRP